MKKTLHTGFILLFWALTGLAQTVFAQTAPTGNRQQQAPPTEFDPQTMPVAIEQDSSLQLLVSEYVLCKSLKAAVPGVVKVREVRQFTENGFQYLVYKARIQQFGKEETTISIPLYKLPNGQYYVSNTGLCAYRSTDCCKPSTCTGTCCGAQTQIITYYGRILARVTLATE